MDAGLGGTQVAYIRSDVEMGRKMLEDVCIDWFTCEMCY